MWKININKNIKMLLVIFLHLFVQNNKKWQNSRNGKLKTSDRHCSQHIISQLPLQNLSADQLPFIQKAANMTDMYKQQDMHPPVYVCLHTHVENTYTYDPESHPGASQYFPKLTNRAPDWSVCVSRPECVVLWVRLCHLSRMGFHRVEYLWPVYHHQNSKRRSPHTQLHS